MQDARTLTKYLHERIPLSQAMAVSVVESDDSGVILTAPLAPNLNHRSTVFGGSISTLAILAGWTLVSVRLQVADIPARIVIKSNRIDYLHPIAADFQAHCPVPAPPQWASFSSTFQQRGKGRIVLAVEVTAGNILAARFQGEYVAIDPHQRRSSDR